MIDIAGAVHVLAELLSPGTPSFKDVEDFLEEALPYIPDSLYQPIVTIAKNAPDTPHKQRLEAAVRFFNAVIIHLQHIKRMMVLSSAAVKREEIAEAIQHLEDLEAQAEHYRKVRLNSLEQMDKEMADMLEEEFKRQQEQEKKERKGAEAMAMFFMVQRQLTITTFVDMAVREAEVSGLFGIGKNEAPLTPDMVLHYKRAMQGISEAVICYHEKNEQEQRAYVHGVFDQWYDHIGRYTHGHRRSRDLRDEMITIQEFRDQIAHEEAIRKEMWFIADMKPELNHLKNHEHVLSFKAGDTFQDLANRSTKYGNDCRTQQVALKSSPKMVSFSGNKPVGVVTDSKQIDPDPLIEKKIKSQFNMSALDRITPEEVARIRDYLINNKDTLKDDQPIGQVVTVIKDGEEKQFPLVMTASLRAILPSKPKAAPPSDHQPPPSLKS